MGNSSTPFGFPIHPPVLYSECKWMTNAHFTTISGHFSANCMFVIHKTEVPTVILRCLTGLNLDWIKSYGFRCRWRPRICLANSQKIATDKWPFYYLFWPFFCQLYANLSQNWDSDGHVEVLNKSKSSLVQKLWQKKQKRKKHKICKHLFLYRIANKKEMEIFAFCVISIVPI